MDGGDDRFTRGHWLQLVEQRYRRGHSGESNPIESARGATEQRYIDAEPTPHSELKVRWRDAKDLSRATVDSSLGLVVDVQNATSKEVSGRLFLVTAGLDSRRIKRPLQDFKLSPKDSLEVVVPVEALTIQSENSISRVRLHAEIQRPNGKTVQSFTPPLFYQFQQSYTKAQFFNEQDFGDLDTTNMDLFDVRGRIKEADGTWTDASVAAAANAEEASRTGGGRVGLSAFGRARADATSPRRSSQNVPPKQLAVNAPDQSPVVFWLYTMWATEYVDSGYGEDYLDRTGSGSAPAAHAQYCVTDPETWSTVYACGWLSDEGSTMISLPVGNYWIWRFTDSVLGNDVDFRTYTMESGSEDYDFDVTGFTVESSTTWVRTYPSSSSEAIQVAAITGQVVNQQEAVGLGMPAGTYRIHVHDEGCGVQFSCYDSSIDILRIDSDVVGGIASHAAWKFIVAHELGHMVQFRGMGFYNFGYDNSATIDQCRCDHYDEDWGNTIHCLQSRHQTGGATMKGFAHMFASRVFNSTTESDASFNYYKPFLNEWDDTEDPPLAFDAYNPHQYMEYWCPSTNEGIELDWLNFFYGISHEDASNPTTVSTLFSIYKRACGDPSASCTFSDTVNWSELVGAALTHYNGINNPLFTRFNDTGDSTGVNH